MLPAIQEANPAMVIRAIEEPNNATYQEPQAAHITLKRAEFMRKEFDLLWKAQSYSGITERIGKSRYSRPTILMDDTEIDHDYDQSVEIEQDRTTHFKLTLAKPERLDTDAGLTNVPFADFKAGADAGTFLHKLYEEIDFTAAKDSAEARDTLDALITTWGPYHGLAPELWTDTHKDAFWRH